MMFQDCDEWLKSILLPKRQREYNQQREDKAQRRVQKTVSDGTAKTLQQKYEESAAEDSIHSGQTMRSRQCRLALWVNATKFIRRETRCGEPVVGLL